MASSQQGPGFAWSIVFFGKLWTTSALREEGPSCATAARMHGGLKNRGTQTPCRHHRCYVVMVHLHCISSSLIDLDRQTAHRITQKASRWDSWKIQNICFDSCHVSHHVFIVAAACSLIDTSCFKVSNFAQLCNQFPPFAQSIRRANATRTSDRKNSFTTTSTIRGAQIHTPLDRQPVRPVLQSEPNDRCFCPNMHKPQSCVYHHSETCLSLDGMLCES